MKHHHYDDGIQFESDELSPALSARIEYMSRKWADEAEERRARHQRRSQVRRRIEDWRDERWLSRHLQDDLLED